MFRQIGLIRTLSGWTVSTSALNLRPCFSPSTMSSGLMPSSFTWSPRGSGGLGRVLAGARMVGLGLLPRARLFVGVPAFVGGHAADGPERGQIGAGDGGGDVAVSVLAGRREFLEPVTPLPVLG